jgi:DNA-binding transcriptional ArsR family regulator
VTTDTFSGVHAFEVLAEPVRRRILELLAGGEMSSGDVVTVVHREFGISQPGVSQHLKVLRENGFATVRADGARRLYAVDPAGLQIVDSGRPGRRIWTLWIPNSPAVVAPAAALIRDANNHSPTR